MYAVDGLGLNSSGSAHCPFPDNNMWSSDYKHGERDVYTEITFDLGGTRLVSSTRDWNYNEDLGTAGAFLISRVVHPNQILV